MVPSSFNRVAVAESLNRDLNWGSEWCDLWGMRLNASKTRSRAMHLQSPRLTIGLTVVEESLDLNILCVAFVAKMTFEKYLRSVYRAAF